MKWEKRGWIYGPGGTGEWNQSHASVPTVDILSDRIWRIYFASRDRLNRSRIGFIDVEAGNPTRILYEHPTPVLELGALGAFDDCGLMPSWIVNANGVKYLFYIGWATRATIPYHNAIGLAVSRDGGQSFERMFDGPIFGLTTREPHFTGTSCVLIENGIWKNWYMSCVKWEMVDGRPEPFYHLKYAESSDGVEWKRDGEVAIDFRSSDEAGIVRASVLADPDRYRMWYCRRLAHGYRESPAAAYRIGYAESADGRQWRRMDERAGIDRSTSGWDSVMTAYPFVLRHQGELYMLYNGNGFGTSGFGYATAIESEEECE